MTRDQRRQLAEETVRITEQGWYLNRLGRRVNIAEAVRCSVERTEAVTPQKWPQILMDADELISRSRPPVTPTEVEVTDEATLAAARRLTGRGRPVLALNFASAKNPGGGFLGGSQAQEESLARSSALYASLRAAPDYYSANRRTASTYYTEWQVYSPAVPVFRDDDGALLDEPYEITFVTAPAVNVTAMRQNGGYDAEKVAQTMRRRADHVLALAATRGHDTLVLGAWGCGVFGNDPRAIAALFRAALGTQVGGWFRQVTFAVFDRSLGRQVLAAFQRAFEL